MTAAEYRSALQKAGAPTGAGLLALDRYAAELLQIDKRTARRYRTGEIKIPGPVAVALKALNKAP